MYMLLYVLLPYVAEADRPSKEIKIDARQTKQISFLSFISITDLSLAMALMQTTLHQLFCYIGNMKLLQKYTNTNADNCQQVSENTK